MFNTTTNQLPDSFNAEDTYVPSGLAIFEAVLGPGLPAKQIIEIHSDLGDAMSKIALQVAAGALRRGLNVAYHDADWNVDDEFLDERIRSMDPIGTCEMGQIDVFAPYNLDLVSKTILKTIPGSKWYDVVIIDSIGSLSCQESSFVGTDRQDVEEKFLRHCREVIARTGQTVLLLNHEPAVTGGLAVAPNGTEHLDRTCDTRIALAEGGSYLRPRSFPGVKWAPSYEVCLIKGLDNYGFRIPQMVKQADGSVDDPASVATFLMDSGGTRHVSDGFLIKSVSEVVDDWDGLRLWVSENPDAARAALREVMCS